MNPLVIEHKVQRWEIVALSVNDPVDHLPDFTVDVCENFADEDFVVESGEVDGVRASVKDCVYTVVFDSLRIVGMLLECTVCEDIFLICAANTDTLVEL